jgi:hypothetical protein
MSPKLAEERRSSRHLWRRGPLLFAVTASAPAFCSCSLSDPTFSEYSQFRPSTSARGGATSDAGSAGKVSAGGASNNGGSGAADTGGSLVAEGGSVSTDGGEPASGGSGLSPSGGSETLMGGSAGSASGGAATGGGATGGGAPCITSGTELCDDFESGQIAPALWQVPTPTKGTSVAVDTTRVHAGKYSLHIQATPGQRNVGVVAESATFPAHNNAFYTRIYAYFGPELPAGAGENFQMGFIVASGKNDYGKAEGSVGMIGGDSQFASYSIFYGDPAFQFGPWSASRVTPASWLCLELYESGAASDTEIRKVWLNDKELVDLRTDSASAGGTGNPNHGSPAFSLVKIGLSQFFSTPSLTDMWVDDVRVSSARIGCAD